jgi:hypothetical protein
VGAPRPRARIEGQMFFPIAEWFPAFALTILIETPVVFVLARRAEPVIPRLLILILAINLATHLAVWYVITQLFLVGTTTFVIAAEGWAIAAEALFYLAAIGGLGPRRSVLIAVTANAASFLAGRLVGAVQPGLLA